MCTSSSRVRSFLKHKVLFFLIVILLAVTSCNLNQPATQNPVPPSPPKLEPLATPTPRAEVSLSKAPASSFLSLSGEARAKSQVALSAKLPARITELKVGVGDQVKKNDLLVVLEHESQDAQVKQAEAALSTAEAGLKGAQAQLDLLLIGATKEQLAAAEAAVRGAEASLALLQAGATKEQIAAAEFALAGAQAQLDLLLAGPRSEQLKIAESQVEIAEQGAVVTIYRVSTYSPGAGQLETYAGLRTEEIKLARQQVELAKRQLELLKAPPRPEDAAQLKLAVDAAKALLDALKEPPRPQQVAKLQSAVDDEKAQLDGLKALPRSQQVVQMEAAVEAARAQVAVAQISLSLARTQRAEAFLYAPLDGAIAYLGLNTGSLALPGVPIITILSRDVEVVISVDEIALGQVKPGLAASITTPAYPDQVFSGKVRAIAPGANPVTRTFDVFIDPQDTKGLLRPGMSATVSMSRGEGL